MARFIAVDKRRDIVSAQAPKGRNKIARGQRPGKSVEEDEALKGRSKCENKD
jgi:hypothetical protein